MKTLHYVAAALLSLSLTGCVSFNPAGPIGEPAHKASTPRQQAVMVDEVVVSDSSIDAEVRKNLGSQFTAQLNKRIERGEYFREVISFPATLGEQDALLKLEFNSLKGKRTPHPGYFPGAILTLTGWIWFNGPIYVDKYDLTGTLTFEDAQGRTLASSQKTLQRKQNTGLWDDDYFNLALGATQLNELVEDLLQDSLQQLANQPQGRTQ
ncbi:MULTISPECIES: hypothetical protein [unclassified Pseudomonas]|uniref:hypothetical protein n=1 Tax=unclassified Pseudomonas TaxID=196821 RepID=UPI0024487995|nr:MULTISPECIES: hypothetical protein [unclassified Pseudomonas]MDG9925276.1 hypothetical protein [Pseudomonas sp. GD04045]MDH0036069.1 hypothetical protein [Pseudomonas sp. GD04019]